MRPSNHKTFMDIAQITAQRSHDSETKVGAVLVSNKSKALLATGFNGFVRGAPDKLLPSTRPEKYKFIVHSEENLVANCARHGISMDDCTLYCTHSPCVKCMRLIFQCGITQVVVKEKYRDFEDLKKMQDIEIEESQTVEGYYVLTYKVRSS
jgi:dCMP deaminase